MSGIGLALATASAFMQFQQGRAARAAYEGQARGLETQAEWTRFNAKGESLKHKKAAADQLEGTLITLARINAVAGAGHMDPFTGNPFGLRIRALNVGGTNYATAKGNELITRLTGKAQANYQLFQAAQARAAGKQAYRTGVFGALFTLGMGAWNAYSTSIPSTPTTTTGGAWTFGGGGGGMGAPVSGSLGMPPGALSGTGYGYYGYPAAGGPASGRWT